MKNPFRKLGTALKIGYSVLQQYEHLADAGLVPEIAIKGVPVSEIDKAARAFALSLKAHHEGQR